MSIETKERTLQWLTGSDTCFLIGAGCSRCAGKPLIGELTDKVLAKVDSSIKTEFDKLKGAGTRPTTIEDLINYLVRYQHILQTLQIADKHLPTSEWIDDSLHAIKKEIVANIADSWSDSPVHARFLQRIANRWSNSGRDIFTLNYDTLIEATLDKLRYQYVDGFRGTRLGWFDPTVFEETSTCTPNFRVHKLHGSINWMREKTGHVRRTVISSADDIKATVVVYPSEQKYLQTQFGVYETLIGKFRARLRAPNVNNCLVTLGYSFNDEHINEAIIDAVNATGSNLTVIAFVGPDSKAADQQALLTTIEARCDNRFNAFVGNSFHVGNALDASEAKILLEAELWKFESLVDYIAGVAI
jgi:SIR2-like domain